MATFPLSRHCLRRLIASRKKGLYQFDGPRWSRTGSPLGAPENNRLGNCGDRNYQVNCTACCQGFRNKVFVIGIPRELGRSSFKESGWTKKLQQTLRRVWRTTFCLWRRMYLGHLTNLGRHDHFFVSANHESNTDFRSCSSVLVWVRHKLPAQVNHCMSSELV